MNIAVLGTGVVGQAIAARLTELGHRVTVGTRDVEQTQANEQPGPYGTGSLAALHAAGADNLAGKVLIDIANPLDFSRGMPPTLSVCNTDSLAEQIQAAFPAAKVVKSLNTMNYLLMVNPGQLAGGEHTVFVSGDDAAAKAQVSDLLRSFGWRDIIDLGDIRTARGVEMLLPIWLSLFSTLQTPMMNLHVVR